MVLIERGEAELWLPEADGERFVGLSGPTKVGFGEGLVDVFDDICVVFFGRRERHFKKKGFVWDILVTIYHVVLGFRWVKFGRFFYG